MESYFKQIKGPINSEIKSYSIESNRISFREVVSYQTKAGKTAKSLEGWWSCDNCASHTIADRQEPMITFGMGNDGGYGAVPYEESQKEDYLL